MGHCHHDNCWVRAVVVTVVVVLFFNFCFVFLISILFRGGLAGAKSVQLQALAYSSLSISTSLLLNIEAEYKLNFTVFLSGFDT